MAYQVVLFDMDGVLCDPGAGITDSIDFALRELGVNEPDKASLRRFVGPPLAHSFKELYGFDTSTIERAILLYRERFEAVGIAKYQAYAGISDLLARLLGKSIRLGVATSKTGRFTDQILKNTGVHQYFEVVAAPEYGDIYATKSDIIRNALRGFGEPDRDGVVMIGDREHDVFGANENGIESIGVLFGYGGRDELEAAGATHIVKSVEELDGLFD